jgi:hypothetical protein
MRTALTRFRSSGYATKREVEELRAAVEELDEEIQEARRLNRRLAEITDIVQELLLPASQRDEERLRQRLETYATSL